MNTQTTDTAIAAAPAVNAIPAASPKTTPKAVVVLSTRYTVPGKIKEGVVCPVCGSKKSRGAGYCLKCYRALGSTVAAREAMEAALEACESAFEGMLRADLGNVDRETVLSVFAGVKIPGGFERKKPSEDFPIPYVLGHWNVRGGKVEISIFAEDISAIVAKKVYFGVLSLRKRKIANGEWVHYFRFQVASGVKADAQLLVTDDSLESSVKHLETLPFEKLNEAFLNRVAYVGFVPIQA
jgi:hypothetical protein